MANYPLAVTDTRQNQGQPTILPSLKWEGYECCHGYECNGEADFLPKSTLVELLLEPLREIMHMWAQSYQRAISAVL